MMRIRGFHRGWCRPTLLGLAALLGLALFTLPLIGAGERLDQVNGADELSVEFTQLDWIGESGEPTIPFSRVGVAEISFAENASQFLEDNGGGFVNVTTSLDGGVSTTWSVQNLYLSYPDEAHLQESSPSVQFDLGVPNGVPLDSLDHVVSVTEEPLFDPPVGPLEPAAVRHSEYHTGGLDGGGSGLSTIPYTIGPWVGGDFSTGFVTATAAALVGGDGVAAVNEDKNGCAPGAVARSIHYLLGDPSVNVQDIYDGLYGAMGTGPNGTSLGGMVGGKQAYNDANGLGIDTGLVAWDGDLGALMDALAAGADVEILIRWNGGGGHAAMVTGITQLSNGQYQITYVDDPNQGNGVAENAEHTITVNPDGSFAGGQVLGFMVETRS